MVRSPRRVMVASIVALIGAGDSASAQERIQVAERTIAPFRQEVPKAAYSIEMVPIPGDSARGIRPFWISRTEVTWEAFDVFIYGLDEAPADGGSSGSAGAEPGAASSGQDASTPVPPEARTPVADAVTRPSKPYLPPDRGFGHEGFAAITMSHACAVEFCRWLSVRSGRKFRLASEDEWEHACGPAPAQLSDAAWFADNAEGKPHRVGGKAANQFGLVDMLGNVAEWVDGRDGKPVVKGGSYRDSADLLNPAGRQPNNRAWNASDPQIPKSKWWLADAPFIGFRIVCEPEAARQDTGAEGAGSSKP